MFAKFRTLQCGLFKDTNLLPLVASYRKALKPWIDNEPKGIYTPSEVDGYYATLGKYVSKRQKTLSDLLTGNGAETAFAFKPTIQISPDSMLSAMAPELRHRIARELQMVKILQDHPVVLMSPYEVTIK